MALGYFVDMRTALAAIVICVTASAVMAQTRDQCRRELKGAQSGADTMAALAQAIKSSYSAELVAASSGAVKNSLVKLDQARRRLVRLMDDYSRAMDDLAEQVRVCARGR